MDSVGVPVSVMAAVSAFQPGIANQAYGQAKQIFNKVKQGNFKFTDIPSSIQDLQNLERLGRNIFTPSSTDVQSSATERCDASPYAVDLIARAPKFKFMFVVQFIPASGYAALAGNDYGPLSMAFTVKKAGRPNIRYHEEDVNYYNFRTKVITKTEFGEMNMSFHDDNMNLAVQFFHAYTRAMTPITGITNAKSDSMEQNGMDFQGNTLNSADIRNAITSNHYPASIGPLHGDMKQIFKEIRLYHVFDWGHRMNVWRFINPRINQLNMDDLDMSVGTEGTELAMTFSYDTLILDPDVSMANNAGEYKLEDTQRGAVYPLRYHGAADPGGPSNSGINPYGAAPVASDACSPMNPINTSGSGTGGIGGLISGGGIGGGVTAAIPNLLNTYSTAVNSLPFG